MFQPLPRASVIASLHGSVDAELKSLKLISRSLQSALTAHELELEILSRVYYKNKSQHRGSLFWRNIVELRRYSECLVKAQLLISVNVLRCMFYGSDAPRTNSMKGSWSQFPDARSLSRTLKNAQIVAGLTEKMSAACLRAYVSFHRSLQSAAFLQLLLLCVAVSSRMRAVSLEMQGLTQQTIASITRLLAIHKQSTGGTIVSSAVSAMESSALLPIGEDLPLNLPILTVEIREHLPPPTSTAPMSLLDEPAHHEPETQPKGEISQRKISNKESKHPTNEKPAMPKKKKRKAPKNEIDDIFGF